MAEFVALQLSAIVDHVCMATEAAVANAVGADEVGGARRCTIEELNDLMTTFPGEVHQRMEAPWHRPLSR